MLVKFFIFLIVYIKLLMSLSIFILQIYEFVWIYGNYFLFIFNYLKCLNLEICGHSHEIQSVW